MTRGPLAAMMGAVLAAGLGGMAVPARAADDAPTPCRVAGLRNEVLCGQLRRPLDPARPAGPQIDVHYVVVPAMARRKLPDPVFLLAGGPGQSAISLAGSVMPLFQRLNNRRDIVFVDQRGTGRSAPLACDDGPENAPDGGRETLADEADPARQFARMAACRNRLAARAPLAVPADLGFFTTTLAMQDLDAVRARLGAPRIDLVGASYGTRAALEYQRQFPDRVRRSVLDGVAPPDMVLPVSFSTDGQQAFDALLAACEAEAACTRAHPTLRADWKALLAGLPREVSTAHPLSGRIERFTLTRETVLGAVRGTLYAPWIAAALPTALHDAAQGRFEGLVGLGGLLGARKGMGLAMGMHFSVVCAEDAPRMAQATDPPGADFGRSLGALYARVCTDWPRGAVPDAFYRLSTSTTPVLLLSGGLDPITPPRHADRVARALGALARSVVVPNAGHGVMGVGCARDLIQRFIDAADDAAALALDTTCLVAVPRPPAFVPLQPGAPT
ncbi:MULTISPECIES: alpha/beta hydrolase [unclassified Rhizobacter]|uniref:alpha/beta hydrolase n=1 Tax=unclassified Rhizobacter TaxID=2640088 RepID=UPI0006FA7344|nr:MULTISPECIES: alpha/beta hydrolase [unclassified Rhizobacter]KQU77880.1 cysteine protease [Rhizobacter sp. Root29]KQW10233.1 cysteine protease [Rhizobacter sp. Root1238]KRB20223.1 cysteine protease [Rhizobacter sp. Root16D2]